MVHSMALEAIHSIPRFGVEGLNSSPPGGIDLVSVKFWYSLAQSPDDWMLLIPRFQI